MIYSSNGRIAYGVKTFVFDTYNDMLQETNIKTGDTAFIIETSAYYMLNHKKNWVEIFPYGRVSSSDDDSTHVIYDGGTIHNN